MRRRHNQQQNLATLVEFAFADRITSIAARPSLTHTNSLTHPHSHENMHTHRAHASPPAQLPLSSVLRTRLGSAAPDQGPNRRLTVGYKPNALPLSQGGA